MLLKLNIWTVIAACKSRDPDVTTQHPKTRRREIHVIGIIYPLHVTFETVTLKCARCTIIQGTESKFYDADVLNIFLNEAVIGRYPFLNTTPRVTVPLFEYMNLKEHLHFQLLSIFLVTWEPMHPGYLSCRNLRKHTDVWKIRVDNNNNNYYFSMI